MVKSQRNRNKFKDYTPFMEAAAKRTPEMRWDTLFENGSDDIILELGKLQSGDGKSLDEKICDLYTSIEQEKNTRLNRHNAIATPTLSADKKQIFDAANPKKNPINVGKFLREYDWALYDDWNRAISTSEKDAKPVTQIRSIPLSDIANPNPVATDEIDPSDLRVIISRDPKKIAEMSTGQRWTSCMAKDDFNFHLVPHDISQGSLVAYLAHKDDPQAHYPLMRQLLKPYLNDAGQTILVPAVIYGGNGIENANSRELLKATTVDFVKTRVNDNACGAFKMDDALYADGEAVNITLGRAMDALILAASMAGYIAGAVKEFRTELRTAQDRETIAKDDASKKAAQAQQAKFKLKLAQLLSPEGLAEQYFRVLRRSSINPTLPAPAMMFAAAHSPEVIDQQTQYAPLVHLSFLDSEKLEHALKNRTLFTYFDNKPEETSILLNALAANNTITDLDFWGNEIGNEGAKALAANTTLTELRLSTNRIGDEGAIALAASTSIIKLNLGSNRIGNAGAQALAANTNIVKLGLSENDVGFEGAQALAQNSTIQSLYLRGNNINNNTAKALAKNTAVTDLDLSHNKLGNDAAKALARNTTLTKLNVSATKIGFEGVKALAKNRTIKWLILRENGLNFASAKVLAANTTLTRLDLQSNYIDDEGAKALAANTTLTRLDLSFNHSKISHEGAMAFASNTTLTHLDLWSAQIDDAHRNALENCLRNNFNLLHVGNVHNLSDHLQDNRAKAIAWVERLAATSTPNLSLDEMTDLSRRRNAVLEIASEQAKEAEIAAALDSIFPPSSVVSAIEASERVKRAPNAAARGRGAVSAPPMAPPTNIAAA